MKTSELVRLFFTTVAVFTVIDLIWLVYLAQPIYDRYIGEFLADTPQIWSAALFYLLFIVGLMYFALVPGVKAKSKKLTLQNGAMFGFMTYMTYELTNHAVIEGWPAAIVPIDIIWGVVLASSVSYISYTLFMRNR